MRDTALLAKAALPSGTETSVQSASLAELQTHGDHRIALTQGRLASQLAKLIDEVVLSLENTEMSEDNEVAAKTFMPLETAGLTSVALSSMLGAGRRREAKSRERRLLAEDMVFSALRNLDQPGWSVPADGNAAGAGAFLHALLHWDQAG